MVWQEFVVQDQDQGKIYLSLLSSYDGKTWTPNRRFLGPFSYKGKQAPIFSLLADNYGNIIIAVATAENIISLFSSNDNGYNFTYLSFFLPHRTVVAPKLFLNSVNEYILFVTSESDEQLGIYYTISKTGRSWTPLAPLVAQTEGLGIHALPHCISYGGLEYVVFQSRIQGKADDYQIYLKTSTDNGRTWSRAIRLTDFSEIIDNEELTPDRILNQRPFLSYFNDRLILVWERNRIGRAPQIYYIELDRDGKRLSKAENITEGAFNCYYPQIVIYNNNINLLWFDESQGAEQIFFATKTGIQWEKKHLSPIAGNSRFARPVYINNVLIIFWENIYGDTSRLFLLEPDHTVEAPEIYPLNFTAGARGKLSTLNLQWNVPPDSSGIEGFIYAFSRKPVASLESGTRVLKDITYGSFNTPDDGTWYFSVAARDNAGNTSKIATILYIKDTTPPGEVTFIAPEQDEEGFLDSNTFSLEWQPPPDSDLAGYSYSHTLLNVDPESEYYNSTEVSPSPSYILTEEPIVSFDNMDNGVWALSVRAIDSAGNAGKANILIFKLNKYVPVTYITTIDPEQDALGQLNLTIYGRGFSEGGLIQEVIIDSDTQQPYDYTFKQDTGAFNVKSDRIISDLRIQDIEENSYYVGLIHPTRGLYFSNDRFTTNPTGTVKYGLFGILNQSKLGITRGYLFFMPISELIMWLVVAFFTLLFIITFRKVFALSSESQAFKLEVIALIEGRQVPKVREQKMKKLKKIGMGLRIKYTLLTTIVVVLIILMVSIPISFYMIETQQRTLADGLFKNIGYVIGGLARGAQTYLPLKDVLELNVLLEQIVMEEAQYAIITGPQYLDPTTGAIDTTLGELDISSFEHIWAHNDPEIESKIKGTKYRLIEAEVEDEVSPFVNDLAEEINAKAIEAGIPELNQQIDDITSQLRILARLTDAESQQKLEELQEEQLAIRKQRDTMLSALGSIIRSVPPYNSEALDLSVNSYTFYSPVVYRDRDSGLDNYFWGLVRINVSMKNIIKEIQDSRTTLIFRIGFITIVAIVLGVIGALIMASITIIPIKKLSNGVAIIRDTVNKEKLKDHIIEVHTRDEIEELADTVNQMTQGLVKAAIANKELIVGKEVQKMFIPLEKDDSGTKRTTGQEVTEYLEIYGYYEGAKGVSGDYFDFKKLDNKHYAIIKCDVAGKGVPAALIMVEVATIFSTYFREWTLKDPGLKIDKLVYRINDMLEERGFKGRFAALTLCLLNSETGTCYFCNAGDNLVQIFDRAKGKMIQIKLPDAPAAGVFPSMLVETQSGFKQISYVLKKGDSLFLFTDGIDEAKRMFRDENFKLIKCNEEGLKDGDSHGGTHAKGSGNEELGLARIEKIVEAVFNKGVYTLTKYHNPLGEEELVFDFSNSEGKIEDAVLALVAVEKVFRIYPDPNATVDDKVIVDKKIDEYLSKYFIQYKFYFKNREQSEETSDYVQFTHLKEDEQYDDLTILAIRKK